MEQAPNPPSADGRTAAAPTTSGLSPAMSAWDSYYKDASRRRRAGFGGGRQLRVEKRRRRLRERVGIGLSALLVGAMMLAFYLVLR
jgi:hypothetical protein